VPEGRTRTAQAAGRPADLVRSLRGCAAPAATRGSWMTGARHMLQLSLWRTAAHRSPNGCCWESLWPTKRRGSPLVMTLPARTRAARAQDRCPGRTAGAGKPLVGTTGPCRAPAYTSMHTCGLLSTMQTRAQVLQQARHSCPKLDPSPAIKQSPLLRYAFLWAD
jgi:hypothetical protein